MMERQENELERAVRRAQENAATGEHWRRMIREGVLRPGDLVQDTRTGESWVVPDVRSTF